MKAATFKYHAPASVDEAIALLAQHAPDAKALAGGQSLVPMLALRLARFDHLVDLNTVAELALVEIEGDEVVIGAMTRQAVAGRSPEIAAHAPLVSRAIPQIGHFQIRNRGTVGGSIAHADPASELPAVAIALGAQMEVRGPSGARRIAAAEFFTSIWETAVAPDELLTALRLARWGPRSGFALEEIAWRLGDFAIAGAACGVELSDSGSVCRAGLALMGMGPTPLRAAAAEASMLGRAPAELDLAEVAALALAGATPSDDVHASAGYRRHVATGLIRRALEAAMEEAGSDG